jgi:hypothetical protein
VEYKIAVFNILIDGRNLENNGMGNLHLNVFKDLPPGITVQFAKGNSMSCAPYPFMTEFDTTSTTLPQCKVRIYLGVKT